MRGFRCVCLWNIILGLSHPLSEPGASGGNYCLMEITLNWLSSRKSQELQPLQSTLFPAETPVVGPSGSGLRPWNEAGWGRICHTHHCSWNFRRLCLLMPRPSGEICFPPKLDSCLGSTLESSCIYPGCLQKEQITKDRVQTSLLNSWEPGRL